MVLENGSLKKKGTISICADCVAIENLANVGKKKSSYSEDSLFGNDAVNDLMNLFGMKK